MEIRVAIFEDNNNMREGLFQLINGSQGFTCTGAFPNCDDLVNRIKSARPDVIVMDIEMPGMSGIEGVRLVRENFPEMKILMETIFDDDEKIFNSICAGAEGYILKNTSPVEILSAIKEIYEGGSPMTPTIANRVLKMVKGQRNSESKNLFNLTVREKEILSCLVEGMSYKLIADECVISADTVNVHIKNIYKKLQVHSKSEAVAKAIKGRIV
jgi:DNA-binding NarL/FixJ family response regulator